MGCTASKLDNEDTVRRCKERRRLIKDAVFARHHLAAAHADYCRSLRLTGSALSDFSSGEPLLVSPQTPSILLPHPTAAVPPSPSPSQPPSEMYTHHHRRHQPPPPPPEFSPTIASSKLPHILSDSSRLPSVKTRKQTVKVKVKKKTPHIFSESSAPATPMTYRAAPEAVPDYASTPSEASSVWNWENFYPPSPPDSEFFNQPKTDTYFNQNHRKHDDVAAVEEEEDDVAAAEAEEVRCSEWGDHYSTETSSTSGGDDVDGDDERETRSEVSRSNFDSSSVRSEAVMRPGVARMGKVAEEEETVSMTSSMRWKNGKEVCGSDEMRIVVRHKDLKEIVDSLKDYFEKAASSGDQVSEMLETGRAQLDRSFRQLKSMNRSVIVFLLIDFMWKP